MLAPQELLGPHGPLARTLQGFTPRAQQQEMAQAVADTLAARGMLVAEAATGTGKTYAYLVPAIDSGLRVIVSTATKTLQDQLYQRDIPQVRDALDAPLAVAILKGRANYLCLHRMELALQAPELNTAHVREQLQTIAAWARRTRTGDIEGAAEVPQDAPVWAQVTSTTDNCLGQNCPAFTDCHVVRARRAAQQADLLVVNHHLLFSDLMLRQEGFGELLPGTDAVVLDEAHQLPEIATQFFGLAVSTRQLQELARDSLQAHDAEAGDTPQLAQSAQRMEGALGRLRLAFGAGERRAPWPQALRQGEVGERLNTLYDELDRLVAQVSELAPRGKALESCARRGTQLLERLGLFADAADDSEHITWYETTRRGFILRDTPVDVAATFRESIARYRSAWVFTSATLAVGESFAHFTRQLGLEEAETRRWDSPFDYARNALLYVPTGLPEPTAPHFTAAVVSALRPVLAASGGRAFVLFTSHRALQEAASLLRADMLDFPLLVQGSAPRTELLARFRDSGDAVLLGTGSFWEGVDVRGPALSCVVIDKLPFAPPDDPVFQARAALMRAAGENPFTAHQLPQAVIALKQGVGRLIRDAADRGVMMICDPRLYTRPYGKVFLRNLPPMRHTRELADVEEFFAAFESTTMDEPGVPAYAGDEE